MNPFFFFQRYRWLRHSKALDDKNVPPPDKRNRRYRPKDNGPRVTSVRVGTTMSAAARSKNEKSGEKNHNREDNNIPLHTSSAANTETAAEPPQDSGFPQAYYYNTRRTYTKE